MYTALINKNLKITNFELFSTNDNVEIYYNLKEVNTKNTH